MGPSEIDDGDYYVEDDHDDNFDYNDDDNDDNKNEQNRLW